MAEPTRSVRIEAFDSAGISILRRVFPKNDWYEHLHPIIDSDAERVRLHVTMIRGEQYDSDGELEVSWELLYSQDGRLIGEKVWHKDDA